MRRHTPSIESISVTWKDMNKKLGLYEETSKKMLRKYKSRFKKLGFNLVDVHSVPTWFFVHQYSKEFGMSPFELCKRLNYPYDLYESYDYLEKGEIQWSKYYHQTQNKQ